MARKIPREFAPFDLRLPAKRETRQAGPEAELLYYRSLLWCKANTWTDGFVPDDALEEVASRMRKWKPRELAAKLCAVGYWEAGIRDGEPGWRIPSWLAWNSSQTQLDEERDRKRVGAMKTNHAKYHTDDPRPDCPLCNPEGTLL